jgi:hypothetical protein
MSAPTPPPPATGSPSGATSPRAQKPKKELKPSQKIKAAAIITKKLVRPFCSLPHIAQSARLV